MKPRLRLLLACLLMIAAALFIYRGVLFPADPADRYPWSSDTWGHLMKTEFLDQQIGQGHYYPQLFPGWYNGLQFLRYYGPLPYYAMVVVFRIAGDIFAAGNWFLLLCGLFGGLSFLLFRKRIGLFPALAGGILFMALPDNLRVAFAEGNLPRVMATALLPSGFYFLLNVLNKGGRRHIAGLAIVMALITLSHAMMAAIFLVGMGLFAVCYWFTARTGSRVVANAVVGMGSGLLLSAWWLLPSLTGGITEISQQSASEAVARFPLSISLNPLLRTTNKEIFYIGASLIAGTVLMLLFWRRLEPLPKSLIIVGFITGMLSSTVVTGLFNSLPLHHLLWPIRFMSFAGFALVLGLMSFGSWLLRSSRTSAGRFNRFVFIAIILVVAADFHPSLSLARGRSFPGELGEVSDTLKATQGWRVGIADLSRLGSAPSYLFTSRGGREQVYGWAYQGSSTIPIIASINFGIEEGYNEYAVDRLNRLGADDILVLSRGPTSAAFGKALLSQGYKATFRSPDLDLFHKDGGPRAYRVGSSILGIGEGSRNLALIFPEVEVGTSPYVDDYSLAFLSRFQRVVLSRFSWHSKARAEELIAAYAAQGGKPIIDLSGSPEDVLAKEPRFLGVYGEPVVFLYQAVLERDGVNTPLLPFRADYLPWESFTPQGLDVPLITFPYSATQGIALGYKWVNGTRVDFIGLNIIFHAVLTHDPVAIKLLEAELETKAGTVPRRTTITLSDYKATDAGYTFTYELDGGSEFIIPMAYHPGSFVMIDGKEVPLISIDNLVSISAPAGKHRVEIATRETPVHLMAKAGSGAGFVFMGFYLMAFVRHKDRDRKDNE